MGIFDRFKKKLEQKDHLKEFISKLGCECQIIQQNDAQGIMTKYHQALIQGENEGFTPLIIFPSEIMIEIVDIMTDKYHRESIIAKANDIDAIELLKKLVVEAMPEEEEYDIAGEFSIDVQKNDFISIENVGNQNIIIAKIPTDKPWEVAAWIPMGGFNSCPLPEEQVAVFKYWYEKYGARPGLVTHDVWELLVEKPPKTQEESEFLAWEQFGFCGDIVWQGVGTVNSLAGSLINSTRWYFWWD
ncbi:DUF4253 domain-containing protein [Paenibacillus allorhizosphaerae]|uniref:DUF4253 domain-containing protein n=1 Tax=Paenibacillus allorhizosphaerae TaxID=2849866 RepID=A0ABM8VUR8_9BACL|nr:DUF4253 domain-containing protein [Paenibacillus allorhizosphaerae]CAG7659071.1 hypothetical protein PAECIP111802_07320 [Paenibacillus allorhizosphaerae]